jgi:aryl-alcohol dehydrogenase-like predicted oxidoreductase
VDNPADCAIFFLLSNLKLGGETHEIQCLKGDSFACLSFVLHHVFGGQTSQKDGNEIIRYAVDHGINFIDTAEMYTGGASEVPVERRQTDRDKLVIATKVSWPRKQGHKRGRTEQKHIEMAVEKSLRSLIRIISTYNTSHTLYVTRTWNLLTQRNRLYRGKVRYIAVSHYAACRSATCFGPG